MNERASWVASTWMRDPIRVAVLGTGQMGSGIIRLVLEKPGLELVGACGRGRERAGQDLGRAIELDRDLGIPLGADLAAMIDRARPQIAIQATCSRLTDALGEIETLMRGGVHVISIAEEMAFPAAGSPSSAPEALPMPGPYESPARPQAQESPDWRPMCT
jgi:4-hydroxy-tetrahydrodipicolinate reductase